MNYSEKQLKAKKINILDGIAQEFGIDYKEEFGIPTPKKALVIAEILKRQEKMLLDSQTNTDPDIHRKLTLEEEEEFRKWARQNYHPGQPINPTWHPVVREECLEINTMDNIEDTSKKKPRASRARSAAKGKEETLAQKMVSDLVVGEKFYFEGQKRVYEATKTYVDAREKPHVVVKTDTPAKNQPGEMDLYYKNHLGMSVYVIQ